MKVSCLVIMLTIVLGYVPANASPASAAPRKSADGIELPAVVSDRRFKAAIPYAGAILGAKPEEVGRVFNVQNSPTLLAKHTPEDMGCDWFVLKSHDADIVAFSLTDGRISKAVLYFETVNAARVANVRKQLETHADKSVTVDVKPIEGDAKKLSLLLTFTADPLEFYLATHTLDPKIAAAMKKHAWIEGMTDEQALMVGDGPGKYAAIYAIDAPASGVGTGTVFSESGGASDLTIIIEARTKREAREEAMKRHKNLKDVVKVTGEAGKAP